MDDGLIQKFVSELETAPNPSAVITQLYLSIYSFPTALFSKFVPTISRFVKIYGAKIVFYAVLDTLDVPDVKQDNIAPLLHYFCKKRLEKYSVNTTVNLTEYAESVQEKIKKMEGKKLKIRSPMNE